MNDVKSNSKKSIIFITTLFFFIITQIGLLLINSRNISFINKKLYFVSRGNIYTGDMFFTGNQYGEFDLIGCNNNRGSITRRAFVLKRFKDYLYFDLGNFSSIKPEINKILIPTLLNSFKYMKLNAINFTKHDFVSFINSNNKIDPELFISANLEIDDKLKSNLVNKVKIFPLNLRNKKKEIEIKVAVTGVSGNPKILNEGNLNIKCRKINEGLLNIKDQLNGVDIKILLFNESSYILKRALLNCPIKFDLVLAQPLFTEQINKLIYINKVPVFFGDEYGQTLCHIKLYKLNDRYLFEYSNYEITGKFPEDNYLKIVIHLLKKKILKINFT
jgi:hypothetical protein